MQTQVSIIIPIYNAENYLDKCITSVVSQKYKNLQIILVDDGSTDNSPQICDKWEKKDNRILVVHQENCGKYGALLHGLQFTKGKYLSFIDADDWIESDYYTHIGVCEEHDLDILIMGYCTEPDGVQHKSAYSSNVVMTGLQLLSQTPNIHTNYEVCYSWRMIFRREFILEQRIPLPDNIVIGEDTAFNLQAMHAANRVLYSPYYGYHYFTGNTSLVRAKYKPTLESDIRNQYPIRKSACPNSDTYEHDMAVYYTQSMVYTVLRNICNSPDGITYQSIKTLLNEAWLVDSYRIIPHNYSGGLKQHVVNLCIKYKLSRLLYLYYISKYRKGTL